jgi:large subunit ribosomal protein L16
MMQPKRTKFRKQFKGKIAGKRAARQFRRVRRVRPEGHRPMPHDRARDRGGAPRHFASREARRPHLDPRVPGRADHAEAARSSHGQRQGQRRILGARVLPGKVLFEMEGMSEEIAREAFRLAAAKLSVSTAFVKRQVRT